MKNETNPFSSPVAESVTQSQPPVVTPKVDSFGTIAKRTFIAWEKLRLWFILILGLITIAMFVCLPNLWHPFCFVAVIFGAVVANTCFMAGPIVDTYIRWLGYRKNWPRMSMFIAGTTVTGIAAVLFLAGMDLGIH